MVRNVHERVVAAARDRVWELVEGLGGSDDRLCPSPAWPPMRLDRPLVVGARVGHAMIRYAVTAYDPGRRLEFTFAPATGCTARTPSPWRRSARTGHCCDTNSWVVSPGGRA